MPQNHRTVDRVTRILEEVTYKPGISLADLARELDAAKSSIHGFVHGLLANGWLYEADRGFFLGPAVYGLTLASGHLRVGLVTLEDLEMLHEKSGVAVFLGVPANENLIYVAEVGSDPVTGFDARSNIRRTLLATAGGKALLAARSDTERESFLRRRSAEDSELVHAFLEELAEIQETKIATNSRQSGRRFALATTVGDRGGAPVASLTLVGRTEDVEPRRDELAELLLDYVNRRAPQ